MPAGSMAGWGYRAGVHSSINADPPYYTLYENTYNVQLEKPNYISRLTIVSREAKKKQQ